MAYDFDLFVIGAGSGGVRAARFAAGFGAKVAVVGGDDAKLARAKELGADLTINYRTTPDWDVAVKEATGGGVQHALELGGAGTLAKSQASLGVGGHVAVIGALDGFGGTLDAAAMVMAAQRATAISVGSRADHQALSDFVVAKSVVPVVDSVLGLDAIEGAYARADKGAFGKVVVTL